MAKKGDIVGAVDFGSRDVRVLIANRGRDGGIQIIGHGSHPSQGCVSQGVIQDLSAAQLALKRALKAAEKEAGVSPPTFFCGVNGKNVESFIREGVVKLQKEVVDVNHLEEARTAASRDLPADGKNVVSPVTAEEWYVDDMRVSDPVGIRGNVLKTRMHIALLPTVIEDNLIGCIESQNRELEDVVFLPLAAALGCLTPEDMELGVAVLDMGRTNTGLAVYRDRRILATHTFEWGGFHITRDVAAGLQVSFEEAADLVVEYGISDKLIRRHENDEDAAEREPSREPAALIKLKSAVRGAPTVVERDELEHIIFERSRELMKKARQYFQSRGLAKNLVRGVVLTGGTASIRNQEVLAESVFEVPARVGLPIGIDTMPQGVNSPEYTPLVGVIRHGFEYRSAMRNGRIDLTSGMIGSSVRNVKNLFQRYFL